jgi:isopentenyl diphosphate isomerase/L-lactate dehydrogenase-like FMN-dependent dehydrogenase
MAAIDRCYNIADLRERSRRLLPKWIFEFVDRGCEDDVAIANNLEAFRRIRMRNRALVDMSGRDLGTTLLGKRVPLPLAIAPTGAAGLCWYEGELALARAAAKFGVPFTMAIGSTTPLEKVAREAGGRLWFQIYIWENLQLTLDLAQRAADHGYEALVVTVDVNLGTIREFNYRNGYSNPFRPSYPTVRDILLKPGWMTKVLGRYLATSGVPKHANNPAVAKNQHGAVLRGTSGRIDWTDLARIRESWRGQLIVKGITHPADAARAVSMGADAIIVSNHGGRNFDSVVAAIDALPDVVAEVGSRTTVMFDSGIRRGSDMVKALALGAKAVLSGRATLWGVAAGGEAGATHALNLLRREYELTLAHVGCRNADELSPAVIVGREERGAERPVRAVSSLGEGRR